MSIQRTMKRSRRNASKPANNFEHFTDTQAELFDQARRAGGKAEKEFWKAHAASSRRSQKPEKFTQKKLRNRALSIIRAGRLMSSLLIRATGAAVPPMRLGEVSVPRGMDEYHKRIYERGTTLYAPKKTSRAGEVTFVEEVA